MKGAIVFAAAALACAGLATAHTTSICFDDSNPAGVAISVHTYHGNNANGATLHVKDSNNVRTNYALNNFQWGGLPSGPSVTCQHDGLHGGSDSTFYTAVVPFSCTAGEILYLWTSSVVWTVLYMTEAQAVTFVCPAGGIGSSEFPDDFTAECNAANPPDLSATDNGAGAANVEEAPSCSGLVDNTSDGATTAHPTCPNTYSFTRHFSFTETGCSGSPETFADDQLITVADTTAPTFTSVPSDVVVNCGTDISNPANTGGSATATDSCQGSVTPTFSDHTPAGQSVCTGQVTSRTWTASDGCGNSVSHVQTITVQSGSPPTITAPADTTHECGSEDTSVAANGQPSVSGGCGVPTVTHSDSTTAGCGNAFTITRTWTATDNCGTSASDIQTIVVRDTTKPAMHGVPADDTVECDSVPAAPTVTATDNCDGAPTVAYSEARIDGDCPNRYTLKRTWTATDACGNSDSHTQTLTVVDTTKPKMIGVPANEVAECTAVPAPAAVSATDNCPGKVSVAFSEVRHDGKCPQTYKLVRTWTATDACGNQNSHTQVVSVQDTGSPKLINVPADTTVECDSVPKPAKVWATDACSNVKVVFTEQRKDGKCPHSYTLFRHWRATDDCGNEAKAVQVITVQDTTAPVMANLPDDVTVECDSVPPAAPVTATDNCGKTQIKYAETRIDGDCPHNYQLVRTWAAFDECRNVQKHKQVITVQDTTAPTQDPATELCVVPKHGSQKNRYACFFDVTKNMAGSFATYQDNCGATTIHSVSCSSTKPVSSSSGSSSKSSSGKSSKASSKSSSGKSSSGKSSSGKSRRARELGSAEALTPCSASGKSSSGSSGRRLRMLKNKKGSASSSKSGSSGNKKPEDGFDIYFGYKEKPDCIYYPQHDMICVHAKVTGKEKQGRTYEVAFIGEDECGHQTPGTRAIWVGKDKKQLWAKGLTEDDCVAPTHKMKCGDGDAMFPDAPNPAAREAEKAAVADVSADLKAASPAPAAAQPASPSPSANAAEEETSDATVFSVAVIGGGALVAAALVVAGVRVARRRDVGPTAGKVITLPGAASAASATAPTDAAVSVDSAPASTPREAW